MPSKRYESTEVKEKYRGVFEIQKSTVELGYMCPRGLTGPPAVTI